MSSLQSTIAKLDDMFQKANKRFYGGELEKPVIAINHDAGSSCYGWCSTQKIWDINGNGFYEINICADYLNRNIKEIVATLLHEMVHLWNLQTGVKDTSRGNSYHNKKFKIEGEKRGLHVEQDAKYGWTITTLNEEGTEFVESLGIQGFELYRKPTHGGEEKTSNSKKSSSRKYICPVCGQSVRATKEIKILCGECSSEDELIMMELEEDEE